MKFRTDTNSFWKQIALSVAMVALGLLFLTRGGLSLFQMILIAITMLAPLLFMFSIGRSQMSTVTIDEQGVRSKTFGITNGRIRWEDMAEVGVGTLMGIRKRRYFLYFVTIPLIEQQRYMINRMKHNNNAVWIELNEKAVDLVEKYYSREIHAMELAF